VVSVSLQDTGSGRTAGGLKTCSGLSFTDQDVTHDCGPVTVTVPHGHSYAVLMTWSYTRDGRTANGSAKGKAFAW
jgi:hypothetical protein